MTAKADPEQLRQARGVRDAPGLNVHGPGAGRANINPERPDDLAAVHAARPAGLARHQRGRSSSSRSGTRSSTSQPIYVAAVDGNHGYPQFQFVVVFTQGKNPVMARRSTRASTRCSASTRTTRRRRRRYDAVDHDRAAPTTPPRGAGRQPDGRAAARPGRSRSSTTPTRRCKNGDLGDLPGATSRPAQDLVTQAQALLNAGPAASSDHDDHDGPSAAFTAQVAPGRRGIAEGSRTRIAAARPGRGLLGPPGIVTISVVEIPGGPPPPGRPTGVPADGRQRHRSRQVQARLARQRPTTTSTRPRRA